MNKLDLDKYDYITKDKVRYYPIADVFADVVPACNWEDINTEGVRLVIVKIDSIERTFSDIDGINKLLERSKPPLGGFDLLLKGIVNIPKPKK